MVSNIPEDFIFSQSSLQDYADCPRRFQLHYLEKQRYPAPEVDDMLEFERRMEQGQRFHQLVHQHLLGIPTETLNRYIQDDEVKSWFDNYLQNGLKDVPTMRFAEQVMTVPIANTMLLAKFDLVAIGDRAVIIDWKTSRKLPKRNWLADKLQTIVYRYVLAKGGARLNGGQPISANNIEMHYWYADHNGKTIRFEYDDAQFQADEKMLTQLIQEIDTRTEFPLTDEVRRCHFCTYRSLCERGVEAGSLDEWDLLDYDSTDLEDFDFDLEQIAEIEF